MRKDVLAVDIGGVIIDRVNDGTDTSFFGENFLLTTAVPDAFEAIAMLAERRFPRSAYLVSKCGRKIEEKTLRWLDHHRFYEQTGVAEAHVRRFAQHLPSVTRVGSWKEIVEDLLPA